MDKKEQEETLPDTRESNVWMGTPGQEGWCWSECAFVKANEVPEEKGNTKGLCPRGKQEREGNKERTPICCLWRRVVLQRTVRLSMGSESLFYLLKSLLELSIELLQLSVGKFQPCNFLLQTFQLLQQELLLQEPRLLRSFCNRLLGIQRGGYVSWCHTKVRRCSVPSSPPGPQPNTTNSLPRGPPPDHPGEIHTHFPSTSFGTCQVLTTTRWLRLLRQERTKYPPPTFGLEFI